MTRLRAIGAYVFAGGFTLGVSRHFDVARVLEETKYGVATAQRNMPGIPHSVGVESWPLDVLRKEPWDFIYGNPPCAAWSQAGAATKKGRDWRSSPLVACTERHFELIETLRPTFWAWESVQQAWQRGEDFVRSLALRASDAGYSTTILLHNAEYLGVPQRRKRFFMVCHRVAFDPRPPEFEPGRTLEEALRGLNDPGEPLERNLGKVRWLLDQVKQGENLSSAWMRCTPPDQQVVGGRGQVVGRPPFTIKRARAGQPAPVVMHELIHPIEHRGLSIKELAILCGYPATYEFIDARDAGQIGRGVCPPVAEYLARETARAIALNKMETSPTFKVVDYTEPPGSARALKFNGTETTVSIKGEELRSVEVETVEVAPLVISSSASVRDVRPKPGLKSGAYIRLLLTMGGRTPDEIVALVRRHYPASKATRGDVSWQRGWLKKHGQAVSTALQIEPAPEPEARERQPLRTGERRSNDPDRVFDKSSLRAGSHGQWVHRDYLAHAFRWGFAGRFVTGDTEVLDVGCGVDVPMINILTMPRNQVPKKYVGVDLNREPRRAPSRGWAVLRWEFNFVERHAELDQFDLVTCFEMLEHMYKSDGLRLLSGLAARLRQTGTLLLSTPVFNGKAAADHLHEWTVDELSEAIEAAGLRIERRHGTFASHNDIKRVATAAELDIMTRLSKYYSGEVMACFLAPLYPDASRNCVWVLKHDEK